MNRCRHDAPSSTEFSASTAPSLASKAAPSANSPAFMPPGAERQNGRDPPCCQRVQESYGSPQSYKDTLPPSYPADTPLWACGVSARQSLRPARQRLHIKSLAAKLTPSHWPRSCAQLGIKAHAFAAGRMDQARLLRRLQQCSTAPCRRISLLTYFPSLQEAQQTSPLLRCDLLTCCSVAAAVGTRTGHASTENAGCLPLRLHL